MRRSPARVRDQVGERGPNPARVANRLNRWEHAALRADDRYPKIGHDPAALAHLFVDLFLKAHGRPTKRIILDLDATDAPLHGQQEGRFLHGYYRCYCYLPLYVFCGRHLLAALLRPSNIDASAGAVAEAPRGLAAGRDPASCRFGLCSGRADGVVRGEPRRRCLWPGPVPPRRALPRPQGASISV